jgi:hypothetical protein
LGKSIFDETIENKADALFKKNLPGFSQTPAKVINFQVKR